MASRTSGLGTHPIDATVCIRVRSAPREHVRSRFIVSDLLRGNTVANLRGQLPHSLCDIVCLRGLALSFAEAESIFSRWLTLDTSRSSAVSGGEKQEAQRLALATSGDASSPCKIAEEFSGMLGDNK